MDEKTKKEIDKFVYMASERHIKYDPIINQFYRLVKFGKLAADEAIRQAIDATIEEKRESLLRMELERQSRWEQDTTAAFGDVIDIRGLLSELERAAEGLELASVDMCWHEGKSGFKTDTPNELKKHSDQIRDLLKRYKW